MFVFVSLCTHIYGHTVYMYICIIKTWLHMRSNAYIACMRQHILCSKDAGRAGAGTNDARSIVIKELFGRGAE